MCVIVEARGQCQVPFTHWLEWLTNSHSVSAFDAGIPGPGHHAQLLVWVLVWKAGRFSHLHS